MARYDTVCRNLLDALYDIAQAKKLPKPLRIINVQQEIFALSSEYEKEWEKFKPEERQKKIAGLNKYFDRSRIEKITTNNEDQLLKLYQKQQYEKLKAKLKKIKTENLPISTLLLIVGFAEGGLNCDVDLINSQTRRFH
jgi:plasmid maintenance system killer protein